MGTCMGTCQRLCACVWERRNTGGGNSIGNVNTRSMDEIGELLWEPWHMAGP
jgi:hypothetical protein